METTSIEKRLERIEQLLLAQKSVFTFNEAVEYTKLSRSYLYKLTSSGLIPHSKPNGKQLYFSKDELDAWLLQNKRKTNSEVEKEATNYITLNSKV